MKKILFILAGLFLAGCINKNGLHSGYYDNCKEYYDVLGVYHHKCSNDILNIDDLK